MHKYQKNIVFQVRLVEKRTFRQIFVAKICQNIQISIIILKIVTLSQYYKLPRKKMLIKVFFLGRKLWFSDR